MKEKTNDEFDFSEINQWRRRIIEAVNDSVSESEQSRDTHRSYFAFWLKKEIHFNMYLVPKHKIRLLLVERTKVESYIIKGIKALRQ